MFNEQFLSFNVLTKPEKDLYNIIQSNAKFKSLADVIKTKVGINNFYNFSADVNMHEICLFALEMSCFDSHGFY